MRDLSGSVVDVASGVFKVVGCRHDVRYPSFKGARKVGSSRGK